MKAIVGLGNPGASYRHNRHNVGWQVLDHLASRWRGGAAGGAGGAGAGGPGEQGREAQVPVGKPEQARHAEIVRCTVEREPVLLVKPLTFMNESGKTVRALVEKEHLALEDVLVIYDDLDLALGRVRVRAQGSSGGHRGIKSIQHHLAGMQRAKGTGEMARADGEPGTRTGELETKQSTTLPSFPRIKVGVGRPPAGVDPVSFVLGNFLPDERTLLAPAIERAAEAVECWLRDGTAATANRFNGV